MKITIYIDNVNYDHEDITDAERVTELIRNHISHLGKITDVYYEESPENKKWWQKLLWI